MALYKCIIIIVIIKSWQNYSVKHMRNLTLEKCPNDCLGNGIPSRFKLEMSRSNVVNSSTTFLMSIVFLAFGSQWCSCFLQTLVTRSTYTSTAHFTNESNCYISVTFHHSSLHKSGCIHRTLIVVFHEFPGMFNQVVIKQGRCSYIFGK